MSFTRFEYAVRMNYLSTLTSIRLKKSLQSFLPLTSRSFKTVTSAKRAMKPGSSAIQKTKSWQTTAISCSYLMTTKLTASSGTDTYRKKLIRSRSHSKAAFYSRKKTRDFWRWSATLTGGLMKTTSQFLWPPMRASTWHIARSRLMRPDKKSYSIE